MHTTTPVGTTIPCTGGAFSSGAGPRRASDSRSSFSQSTQAGRLAAADGATTQPGWGIAAGAAAKHHVGMPTPPEDEFAEFETNEATFDAMMAEAEPAELVAAPARCTAMRIELAGDAVFTLAASWDGFSISTAAATAALNGES